MKIKQLNYAKGKFGEEEAKQFLIASNVSLANAKTPTTEENDLKKLTKIVDQMGYILSLNI